MNWLRKMAGYFSRPVNIKDPSTWPSISGGHVTGEASALALSSVFACTSLLTGVMSSFPCQVFRPINGGGRELLRDHGLYRLLHDSPNIDQTALEFWQQILLSLELRGNAYAEKTSIGDRVVSLTPVHPDAMSVRRLDSNEIEYSWSSRGRLFKGGQKDILHFRGFGGDALGGMSTLTLATNTLNVAKTIDLAAQKAFDNGMSPSGLLKFKTFLPTEKRQQIKDALKDEYMGAVNRGRPMVLEGDTEWVQLSIKPDEAQMLESRGFSVEEICRFFGVPPFLIGHTEKTTSWGTGLSEQVLGFQKFTLHPRVERIEQRLMKDLLSVDDRARGIIIEFNFEGLLRADTKARYDAYAVALQNGFTTINRVLAKENEPPVLGGDVPRMQSQNIPITQAVPLNPVE
jgi:HK97 family phage portal protein